METPSKNIQLQLSGFPSQFDYCPGSDSIVAVTPDSISLHSLENAGSPRKIFYYDINLAPLSVSVQKMGYSPLIATLNNNSFCLWDTSKSCTSLIDVQVFRDTVTYAFDWSPINPALFATASTNGFASIWDRRMSLNRPSGATFVGKKVVQHLSWCPFNDIDITALVNDEYILKWDARMTTDQQFDELKPKYFILRSEDAAVDITWKDSSSFWILSSDRISNLSFDKQCVSYPINVGDNSNTTQSFLWNSSGQLCAVISTRKTNFDTIINFFAFIKDKFVFRDNIVIAGRTNHCFWRRNDDVFVVVNPTGNLRFFDLSTSAYVPSAQEPNPSVPDDDYFLGRQSFENRLFSIGDITRNMYAELKSLGLVDHCHDRAYLEHSAREQLQYHSSNTGGSSNQLHNPSALASLSASATLKNVVGPRTFYMLLSDELKVLEQAMRFRALDGVSLTQCDAFNRLISLDYNLSVATPNSGAFFRNFGVSAANLEMNSNIVSLTIIFPKKLSHFWNMNFTIENRSHHKLEIETLKSEFIKEVQEQTQALVKGHSRLNSITTNSGNHSASQPTTSHSIGVKMTLPTPLPVSRTRSIDFSIFILFNVARIFREKVIHFWELSLAEVRRMSNSSYSQQTDSRLEGDGLSESIGDGDSEGKSGNIGPCGERGAQKMCRTPFPMLSAGVFNGDGALVLFGNAMIDTRDYPQHLRLKSQSNQRQKPPLISGPMSVGTEFVGSDYVKDIPSKHYLLQSSSLTETGGSKRHRHVCYATYSHLRDERERLAKQQLSLTSGAKGLRPLDTIDETVSDAKESLEVDSESDSDSGSDSIQRVFQTKGKRQDQHSQSNSPNKLFSSSPLPSPSKEGAEGVEGENSAKNSEIPALSDTEGSIPDLEDVSLSRLQLKPQSIAPLFSKGSDGEEDDPEMDNANSEESDELSEADMHSFGQSPNVTIIDAILEKGETAMREKLQLLPVESIAPSPGSSMTTPVASSSVPVPVPISATATKSKDGSSELPKSKTLSFLHSDTPMDAAELSTPAKPLGSQTLHLQAAVARPQSLAQQRIMRNSLRVTESLFPRSLSLAARYVLSGIATAEVASSTTLSRTPSNSGLAANSPISIVAVSPGHRTDSLVAASRQNALIVARICPSDHALQQFWHLLSVALDVYQVAETEADLIRWSDSALGRNLLHRLVHFLIQRRDVQTWGTVLALLGGAETLCRLLYGAQQNNSASPRCSFTSIPLPESYASTPWVEIDVVSLEVYILVYAQCLHRWGCDLHAMQVRQCLLPVPVNAVESKPNHSTQSTTTTTVTSIAASPTLTPSKRKKKSLLDLSSTNSVGAMYQLLVAAGCQTFRNGLLSQTLCQLCDEEDSARFASMHAIPTTHNLGTNNNGIMSTGFNGKKLRKATSSSSNMGNMTRRSGQSNNTSDQNLLLQNASRTPSISPHVSSEQLLSTSPSMQSQRLRSAARCQLLPEGGYFPCVVCLQAISSSEASLVTFCVRCGHGGHDDHLRIWFAVEEECPAVCGCLCRQALSSQPRLALEQQALVDSQNLLQQEVNGGVSMSRGMEVHGSTDEDNGETSSRDEEDSASSSPITPLSGIIPPSPFFAPNSRASPLAPSLLNEPATLQRQSKSKSKSGRSHRKHLST